jgi:hypothetical protein
MRGYSTVNSRVDRRACRAADSDDVRSQPRALVANLIHGGIAATLSFAIAAIIVAGCGGGGSPGGAQSSATDALPSYSLSIADARGQVARALARSGLQLIDARQPFRPPESAALAQAPRGIFQVVLPDDPSHGFIVIYEFRDEASAATAGREQAAYLGSGPGRVQFPPDTQHLVRQAGTTVVVYSWSPANSSDSRAPAILADLSTVGTGIAVPR